MIHAIILKNIDSTDETGMISGIDVQGHAGYAEEGKDIICSAVSAIMYTAAGALEEIAGFTGCYSVSPGGMKIDIMGNTNNVQMDNTNNVIMRKVNNEKDSSVIVQTILKTAEIGLKQIEISYGSKYISVTEKIRR